MKPEPLVSVICTARNASRTLEPTLRSALKQTLSHWEMIIVDDGSTDDTVGIAARYARQDRRFSVIRTPGVGRGQALNLALSCARAELIANVDADDASHPRRLELQSVLMSRQRQVSILCTDALYLRQQEQPVWPRLDPAAADRPPIDVTSRLALHNPVVHSSVMLRRADVLQASGYAENILSQFDYELWVRMAARGHRIHWLNLPLAAKRLHDHQSFEARRRLTYLYNSARVQREAIRVCRAPRRYVLVVWARFLFGLLPRQFRRALRRGTGATARTLGASPSDAASTSGSVAADPET